MKPLLVIILLLSGHLAFAQTFTGRVIDAKTGAALYPVTVVNLLTQQSAYTNEKGEFSLIARNGEQVAFSYVGYKTVQKVVTADASKNVKIDMEPLSFQLKELVIRPQDYTPYQIDSIYRSSTYKRAIVRQHASVMSPVSYIAERFSKKSKEIKEFQQNFNYWEDQRFIDSRYSAELVGELTDLEGDSLAYFMNAYPMPYDYARTATELEVKMWIRTNFKEWQKSPKIPAQVADSLHMTNQK